MAGRHDWNTRENYFDIHYRVLRFAEKHMVAPVRYIHQVYTDRHEAILAPKIVFLTWGRRTTVHVSIKKDILIRRRPGFKPEARTYSYRYHANLPDGRELIRYCSPDDPNSVLNPKDHHTFHHKHVFDSNGVQIKVINIEGNGDEWPHVSDFLNEVLSSF